MSSVEVISHRKMPQEWPGLLDLAGRALPAEGYWEETGPLRKLGEALVPLDMTVYMIDRSCDLAEQRASV
jgi:hypothetical protein